MKPVDTTMPPADNEAGTERSPWPSRIAALVLVLQVPLSLINNLREERASNHGLPETPVAAPAEESVGRPAREPVKDVMTKREILEAGYHMTYRALK